jgi:uncharacterized protein HemX
MAALQMKMSDNSWKKASVVLLLVFLLVALALTIGLIWLTQVENRQQSSSVDATQNQVKKFFHSLRNVSTL